ncbi:transcriptional regulator, CdaR family [Desulfitobacterium dehalogenans ATCC 51507]|uniref:Transcriptional regulator, CdaR family n=1 Tax=Desulfitobacterium dehalogenans (strain ATCC 51507 / DSM 9161 / JW/IU-DC1) TaxID=756499 RepID=I4ADB9_DESDJ|nr:helix-turn-helix domain-containing protein [Desulfitobacterium dehalogenans]AFM01954.1 transcriptional regulator, CdaR family [Desulfitobacterium dehalogenans ATCC 51507]
MNINMHVLLDELRDLNPQSYLNDSIDLTIRSIAVFDKTSDDFSADTLYLATTSALAACEGKLENVNLIAVGLFDPDFAKRNRCNIICFNDSLTPVEIAGHIFGIQKKYDDWNNKLLSAMIAKKPMKNLFDIALEEIHNPMMLIGPLNTLILAAGVIPESCTDTIWRELLAEGYLSYEHPLYSEFLKMVEKKYSEQQPFIVKFPMHNYTYLIGNIFQSGKRCGALQLIEVNQPFSLGQITLVAHFKSILEQAIKTIPDLQILSSNSNAFVYQLLNHIYVRESIIINCLQSKGWKVFDEFFCLNFMQNKMQKDDIFLKIIMQELSRVFPAAIILDYKDGVVVILRHTDFAFDREHLKGKLSLFVKKFFLTIGVSSVFYDFKNLKRHYDECSLAIKYGLDQDHTVSIHFFNDHVFRHLSRFIFVENGKNQFIHTKVELLHQYDLKNDTELAKTLLTYFQFGQNKSLAAEKMHLHRNTLTYRLNIIKNLVDIDCSNRNMDENEIFHIMLSCKFLEYML